MILYTILWRTVLCVLLFGGRHAVYSGPTEVNLELNNETDEEEKEIKTVLSDLVNLFSKLIDWRFISLGGNVLQQPTNIVPDTNVIVQDDIKTLLQKYVRSLRRIECTYAYYAKMHLITLHKFIDEHLLFDETFAIVQQVNSKYLDAALKAQFTLIKVNYPNPDWMVDFIKFLKVDNKAKFHRHLENLMHTLQKNIFTEDCRPKSLPSIVSQVPEQDLLSSDNNQKVNWQELVKLHNENNNIRLDTDVNKWVQDNNLNNSRQNNNAGQSKCSRIYGNFFFNKIKNIKIAVNENISNLYLLLSQNHHILSHKDFDAQKDLSADNGYEPIKFKFIAQQTINDENTYSNDIYDEEIKRKRKLLDDMSSLNGITIVRPLKPFDVLQKTPTDENNPMCYQRRVYANLNLQKNLLMNEMECTYLYYAIQHLKTAQNIINSEVNNSVKKESIKVIGKYFTASLKTLATILNAGYQASEWMVQLVLYLEKIPALKDNKELLSKKNEEMSTFLTSSSGSCDFTNTPAVIPTPKINILDSTEGNLNDLQLKILFNGIVKTSPHTEYETRVYENLAQVNYLLTSNRSMLQYDNYMDFSPKKWLMSKKYLNENIINTLRWDETEKYKFKNDNGKWWKAVNNFWKKVLKTSDENETSVVNRIKSSVWISSRLLIFMRAALIRYSLLFLTHCKNIKLIIDGVEMLKFNPKITDEYKIYCSGTSEMLRQLLQTIGLEKDEVFTAIINEMDSDKTIDEKHTRTVKMAVKKLYQCSIYMKIEAHRPIRPIWNSKTLLVNTWPFETDRVLERVFYWVKDVKRAFLGYMHNFIKNFHFINFRTHNLLLNSFGNQWSRPVIE